MKRVPFSTASVVRHESRQHRADADDGGSGAPPGSPDARRAVIRQSPLWTGIAADSRNDAANRLDPCTGATMRIQRGPENSGPIDGGAGVAATGTGAAHDLTGTHVDPESRANGSISLAADVLPVVGSDAVDGGGSSSASALAAGDAGVSGASSSLPGSAALSQTDHPGYLTVQAGASLVVSDAAARFPIWNDGTLELAAGSAIPTGQILGSGTVMVDADFETSISYAATFGTGPSLGANQHLRFNGPNAALFITNGANDVATPVLVENFGATDAIAVSGSVQSMQVVSTANGDMLELVEQVGGVHGTIGTQYIQFDRDYAADGMAFSTAFVATGAFGSGYTTITVQEEAACFCPGTLIATPDGDRPVEQLRIGDIVRTTDGSDRPVLWIGRRSYQERFVAGRQSLLPVRIRAGALGAGTPKRDLLVSPRHAMLVQDVLVPAELLLNGRTVMQRETGGDVKYLHIELENHAMLIAEGAATESFVDDNSRSMFENAAEFNALYPDRAGGSPSWPVPRVEHGERLLVAQNYVNALAGMLPRTTQGGLRGHLDAIENGRVRGWAWCPEQPEAPVLLDILLDGAPVAQVLADRYRADLAEAGIGTGCHGFEAIAPEGAGVITLRRACDGQLVSA